ncbi:hypothetical protein CA13_62830 [Planctomycetes bacterium CA13]|uniref:Uncharacterized protein n=1 Tax=Novipirellula herctigrandis TaxID=2527986 RepID=A0A5C5ZBV7_9BACT|nr:hypothetical protein CA13_62830 [Planctomycetes bacterium CA13]
MVDGAFCCALGAAVVSGFAFLGSLVLTRDWCFNRFFPYEPTQNALPGRDFYRTLASVLTIKPTLCPNNAKGVGKPLGEGA